MLGLHIHIHDLVCLFMDSGDSNTHRASAFPTELSLSAAPWHASKCLVAVYIPELGLGALLIRKSVFLAFCSWLPCSFPHFYPTLSSAIIYEEIKRFSVPDGGSLCKSPRLFPFVFRFCDNLLTDDTTHLFLGYMVCIYLLIISLPSGSHLATTLKWV